MKLLAAMFRVIVSIALAFLTVLVGLLIYIFRSGPKLPSETDAIIEQVLSSDLPELVSGQTGFAESDGLQIWYESIKPDAVPIGTVLLNMSHAGSGLEWPPKFIRLFVDAGYRVIRYDHRGTGISDWVENWSRQNPYLIADMAGDALAVLDALQIQKAHIVGLSLGGMVAQELATRVPERVVSLTLMMTSGFIGDPDLPSLTSRFLLTSVLKGLPLLKYRIAGGEKNLIKERIAKMISFVGDENLDIRETAEVVLYDMRKRRGFNIRAVFQHQAAVSMAGSCYEKLKTFHAPTLVIHGTADQLIPVEHGRKLVDILPNARGLRLDGVEHMFPFPNMIRVNETILAHLSESGRDEAQRPS